MSLHSQPHRVLRADVLGPDGQTYRIECVDEIALDAVLTIARQMRGVTVATAKASRGGDSA